MRLGADWLLWFLGASAAQAAADKQAFDEIARGRYLAIVGDCAGCHSAPGGAPYADELPIETPFGTLVSPNITPDRDTGIGAWSDEEFVNAMQDGTGRGSDHLCRRTGLGSWPMDDVVAYLKTGHNNVSAATGPMSGVIVHSTSQ